MVLCWHWILWHVCITLRTLLLLSRKEPSSTRKQVNFFWWHNLPQKYRLYPNVHKCWQIMQSRVDHKSKNSVFQQWWLTKTNSFTPCTYEKAFVSQLTLPRRPAVGHRARRRRKWWGTRPLRCPPTLCSWLAEQSPQSPAQCPLWSEPVQIYCRTRQLVTMLQKSDISHSFRTNIPKSKGHDKRCDLLTDLAAKQGDRWLLTVQWDVFMSHGLSSSCMNLLVHGVRYQTLLLSIVDLNFSIFHLCNISIDRKTWENKWNWRSSKKSKNQSTAGSQRLHDSPIHTWIWPWTEVDSGHCVCIFPHVVAWMFRRFCVWETKVC